MDSIEGLFQSFPTSKEGLTLQDATYRKLIRVALQKFLEAPRNSTRDPDCEQIRRIVSNGLTSKFCEFATQLSQFALSKPLEDEGSAKSHQLLYYRWVALGRRDDENPFYTRVYTRSELQQREQSRSSYAFLPDGLTNTKICSYCGRPGAQNGCDDCEIIIDSQVIHGETFCGQACLNSYWPQHKTACIARQNLYRSVVILYDLFLLIKEKTYPVQLGSVHEQHGIVFTEERHWDEAACGGEMAIHPFPRALTSSKEQFRAILLSADCDAMMAIYKPLLDEFLIRKS